MMKAQELAIGLTVMNLALMIVTLADIGPRAAHAASERGTLAPSVEPQEVVPVVRGRAFELLDEHDRVRSRISVEPNGEVVLRLLDKNGTIRVKLGASETGSGLLLLDQATEPGVHITASKMTRLTLRAADRQRVIRP